MHFSTFKFVLPILAAVSPVAALVLQAPTNPGSGATTDITWTNGPNDPSTWSLFLVNASQVFSLYEIIGESIDPAPGHLTTTFPTLKPGNDYALHAVNATNVDFIIASSPLFSISD